MQQVIQMKQKPSETKNFLGGVPTDIEVRRLREAYPEKDLQYGMEIPYDEVSKIIGCKYRTNRWMAVTERWRRQVERETNIIIGTGQPGVSFKVLQEHEKVTLSSCKLRNAARSVRRSYTIATRVDVKQLSDQQLREYDHSTKRAVALMQSEQLKSKVPLPVI